jgi:large subunit ribosomal protein L18
MTFNRARAREIRRKRVRRKVKGIHERPRLCVFFSNRHVYTQVIDDAQSRTLVSASSLSKELRGKLKDTDNRQAAIEVGKLVADRCQKAGIENVVFDRNGFLYHGRVRALADAAREAGLKF